MTVDIQKISKLEWEKKWAAPFALPLTTMLSDWYYNECAKQWEGRNFKRMFFVVTRAMVTCYQAPADNAALGQLVAKKLEDRMYRTNLDKTIKSDTNSILAFIKRHPDIELLSDLKINVGRYLPLYIGIIRAADYVDAEHQKEILPLLDELRLYTEPVFGSVDGWLRQLTNTIADQNDYDKNLFFFLTDTELDEFLRTKNLPGKELLVERGQGVGVYMKEGKNTIVGDQEAEKIKQAIEATGERAVNELKGTPASAGEAEGVARIIFDPHKIGIFNEGDILVAEATRPDYLPLMKKAAAIVTDAGGMLSHAAVVARELGVPCVIGTKIATKVLKDGDRVEVDATQGIIKKLLL